ncbi:DUF6515 family protein [Pseudomonas nitroreducens]|uniref:DUF6515 family protein n=1 Tax=Pseudomonas nitroreducens TaxID=46680 RepID=UPI003CC8383E
MKSGIWQCASFAVLSLLLALQSANAAGPDGQGGQGQPPGQGGGQGRPSGGPGNTGHSGGGQSGSHDGQGHSGGGFQGRPTGGGNGGQWQGRPPGGNNNGQWQGHPSGNAGNNGGQWQGRPPGGNNNGQWQGRPPGGNNNGQWQGHPSGNAGNNGGQWQGRPSGGNNNGQWQGHPPGNTGNNGGQWQGRPPGYGSSQWQGRPPSGNGHDMRPPAGGWQGRPPPSHGNWGPHPSNWRPGYVVNAMPPGYYRVPYRGGSYYFNDGYWYRPYGSRYVVVTPPYGVRVRYLPSYAEQVWIGSIGYFLAAGTYYLWQANSQEYEVVAPPQEAQPVAVAQSGYDLVAYPLYNQGPDQQARDRYECHRWAADQSGFDPALASYAPPAYVADNYRRALGACLSGRGYSVN